MRVYSVWASYACDKGGSTSRKCLHCPSLPADALIDSEAWGAIADAEQDADLLFTGNEEEEQ